MIYSMFETRSDKSRTRKEYLKWGRCKIWELSPEQGTSKMYPMKVNPLVEQSNWLFDIYFPCQSLTTGLTIMRPDIWHKQRKSKNFGNTALRLKYHVERLTNIHPDEVIELVQTIRANWLQPVQPKQRPYPHQTI